jgi:hypothetical protein
MVLDIIPTTMNINAKLKFLYRLVRPPYPSIGIGPPWWSQMDINPL